MLEKLLLSPNLIGLIFIVVGLIQMIFPPKKINSLYGYRTPRSMKNIEVWNFAQKLSAKLLIALGSILILFGIFSLIIGIEDSIINIIGMVMMIVLLVILMIYMEVTIKKKFSNNL